MFFGQCESGLVTISEAESGGVLIVGSESGNGIGGGSIEHLSKDFDGEAILFTPFNSFSPSPS